MIVTTAAFGSHRFTLIAHVNDHPGEDSRPMLVEANWLLPGNTWHRSKSIPKLKNGPINKHQNYHSFGAF